ncbi:MAG: hypothetical protein WAM42_01440 [Candidatus Nitrosopolaris sp.]
MLYISFWSSFDVDYAIFKNYFNGFTDSANSIKAGMPDYPFSNRSRYLLINEIDDYQKLMEITTTR